jgi:hypothetical protein
VDMPALPGVLGLEIIRHYNSAYAAPRHQNGAVGRGWRLSYETELFDMYGKIQIMQADGGRVIFDRDQKNTNLCSTRNPANGTMALVPQKNGAREYVWTWTNGRKLFFDTEGKLYRIAAPTGEFVLIDYDQRKVLRRVTDPQGRRLDLAYFDPKLTSHFRGVQFIDSPVGRFEYQYGSAPPKGSDTVDVRNLLALLVKVKLPTRFEPDKPAHPLTSRGTTTSQISRLYHHEDPKSPWLLTGISVETTGADRKPVATRYSTYGYDSDGRAVLSTHANNVNKVTLDNHAFGKTVLTNSLGQKTTYMHAVRRDQCAVWLQSGRPAARDDQAGARRRTRHGDQDRLRQAGTRRADRQARLRARQSAACSMDGAICLSTRQLRRQRHHASQRSARQGSRYAYRL